MSVEPDTTPALSQEVPVELGWVPVIITTQGNAGA